MEGIVPIAIWISLILIVACIVVIVLFGIRSLVSGKFRPWTLGAMLLPVAIFGIAYAINSGSPDAAVEAGVLTVLVLLAAGALAVLVTGVKGLIGF